MGKSFRIWDVVHRNKFDVSVLLHGGSHDISADTTEPVDADFYAHVVVLQEITSVRIRVLFDKLGRKRGILVAR